MAIDASTGDFSVSNATPAGAYTVTVRAIDSTGTPLAGNATFTVTIGLLVANSAINNTVVAGAAGTINTVTATGQTSGVTYTLDSTTTALGWVTITNGVVAVTTSSVAGTHPVTVTATSTGSPTGGGSSHGVGTVTYNFTIQP